MNQVKPHPISPRLLPFHFSPLYSLFVLTPITLTTSPSSTLTTYLACQFLSSPIFPSTHPPYYHTGPLSSPSLNSFLSYPLLDLFPGECLGTRLTLSLLSSTPLPAGIVLPPPALFSWSQPCQTAFSTCPATVSDDGKWPSMQGGPQNEASLLTHRWTESGGGDLHMHGKRTCSCPPKRNPPHYMYTSRENMLIENHLPPPSPYKSTLHAILSPSQ